MKARRTWLLRVGVTGAIGSPVVSGNSESKNGKKKPKTLNHKLGLAVGREVRQREGGCGLQVFQLASGEQTSPVIPVDIFCF